jgi:hypothetical protein
MDSGAKTEIKKRGGEKLEYKRIGAEVRRVSGGLKDRNGIQKKKQRKKTGASKWYRCTYSLHTFPPPLNLDPLHYFSSWLPIVDSTHYTH